MEDRRIHCPECRQVIEHPEGAKSGDQFQCPCGKINVQLYTVTALKGKKIEG